MFHKEDSSIGGQGSQKSKKAAEVPVKKQDRKALRSRAKGYLERILPDDCNTDSLLDVCFLKGQLTLRTLPTDRGGKAWKFLLYQREPSDDNGDWPFGKTRQTVWIALEEKGKVRQETPTVALWAALFSFSPASVANPKSFAVQIPSPASKFICRGADVMAPGIVSLPAPSTTERMRPICILGNPQPFAVGWIELSDNDWQDLANGPRDQRPSGVGVTVWNSFGDDFWKHQYREALQDMALIQGDSLDNGCFGNPGFILGHKSPVSPTMNLKNPECMVVPIIDGQDDSDSSQVGIIEESASALSLKEDSVMDANVESSEAQPHETESSIENAQDPGESASLSTPPQETAEELATRLLQMAFLKALWNVPKSSLPMPVSVLYAQHVLNANYRPEGTTIQVKATKYKKFASFLQEFALEEHELVAIASKDKDPYAQLTAIHRSNVKRTARDTLDLDLAQEAEQAPSNDSKERKKTVVVSLQMIPSQWIPALRLDQDQVQASNATSEERRGTGMLTAPEVRTILEDYLQREDLVDSVRKDKVHLDGPLTDILYASKKNTSPTPQVVLRKDLVKLFAAKCKPAYALVEMPGSKIVQLAKGSPPAVDIEVTRAAGGGNKKYTTFVRGMEAYNVHPKTLSKDISHRFACAVQEIESDTVVSHHRRPALAKGKVELKIQGSLADELTALLTGDNKASSHGGTKDSPYQIPKAAIQVVLRKGVPGKKK